MAGGRAAGFRGDPCDPEDCIDGPVLREDTLEHQAAVVLLEAEHEPSSLAGPGRCEFDIPVFADREQRGAVFPDPRVKTGCTTRGS